MANTLKFSREGAVGFIGWLGAWRGLFPQPIRTCKPSQETLLGSAVIRLVERPGFDSADVLRLDGFCLTKQAL